jgi:hypothetical protein
MNRLESTRDIFFTVKTETAAFSAVIHKYFNNLAASLLHRDSTETTRGTANEKTR